MPPATVLMKTPSLCPRERRIVKRLLLDGVSYQDVQQLVNTGRSPTINPGRLAGYKEWPDDPATSDDIDRYRYEKSLVDLKSGLSPIDDERIFKAREAMISAVQIFNTPTILFKTEIFPVLSQIAWTYLLHEYYIRKGVPVIDGNGNALLISQILNRPDCPLQDDVKKNLVAVKALRDNVEHKILASLGRGYWSLFQANCLNFDQAIRTFFGEGCGIDQVVSLSLQFARMNIDQLSNLQKYDLSPEIEAIDENIKQAVGETGAEGVSYRFKVVYQFEKAARGSAHITFTDNNKDAKNITTVLSRKVVSDDLWPYKPYKVVAIVRERTGQNFTTHHHQLAWKKFAARPNTNAKDTGNCNKEYCCYHNAHRDYTYSDKWIDLLVSVVSNDDEFEQLKTFNSSG